jgi:Flp pilus assembly protein TadG
VTAALLHRLARDQRGTAAIEFAFVAPVLLMIVFGLFDLGHNMYTGAMLQGAIQQSARNSTIEGADAHTADLDAIVTSAVQSIAPNATLQFNRQAYTAFSDVSQPEEFVDSDSDNICNNGETFEDANGNGAWDNDRGSSGHGGARDAVLYSVTVNYPRMFPIAKFIPGQTADFTMKTETVLRNQPFGQQDTPTGTGTCT